ncbi:flagellar hook protein FlgE [Stutzerimonas xanthomarina]|uniref:Flagellar hook protein FlgE n=1 Tax=Stutzerimonas xanthomarina TaxID=271420 RepID=A0A3R8V526_9GAMM|nr:flagellar hook protein FlgE [Stutzerimonas xanthomarina]RRV11930.1 flagellar hook protein FlgE [Stutzerimonas xanthomarina]TVT65944.1 MAG: flagellar hook protein FlgE [Pseudomonas sp.]
MSFNIGLSGLRAASKDLNVTGNNIANAGTVGFKQSRAEFSDVYAASVLGTGKNPQGSGVLMSNISQQFNQGNINYTQNALDLAINGNGFFQVSNNGAVSYTRAGYFGTDREGFLVDNFGYKLQGFPVDGDGNLQNGVVGDLQVQTTNQAPKASSKIDTVFNLNSTNGSPSAWTNAYEGHLVTNPGDTAGALDTANLTFNPADPTTYNSSTSLNIYDSQGNAHVMTQYFVKTSANTWDMRVLVDGRNPANPSSTDAFDTTLSFDSAGNLQGTTVGDFALNADGTLRLADWVPAISNGATPAVWDENGAQAAPGGITIDLTKSTQFASAFAVNSVAQDGYTTGELAGLEIDDTGVIFARYTNGQSKVQGQIILANFANVQGLTPVGKSQWVQSFESGEPVVGTPGSGTLGALQAGALEDSNVELSDQLVNLIVAQRNYQANAKTIETESAITQTIINLR